MPEELGEGLMASPSLGWTLTWTRRESDGLPVFLTLTHDPASDPQTH